MPELATIILNGDGATADELQQGLAAGAAAVMGSYRPEFVAVLKQLRHDYDFEVYPVVPNAPAYVRDLADLGMAGAAVKRLWHLSPAAWFRLAAYGAVKARRVLAQDFGTMMGVMIQMELPAFASLKPPVVFLHAQMTDLLLACGNADAFRSFASLARRHRVVPGLQTRNFGHLVPRLREWKTDIPVAAAPFNPQGYGMHPSPEACEALLAERQLTVVAEDVLAKGAARVTEAAAYVTSNSLDAVVLGSAESIAQWGAR